MAKVQFGPEGMRGWRGKSGNALYRMVNGQTVVQQAPVPGEKRDPTPKQQERHDATREAAHYGSRAVKNPALRPIYEAIAEWEHKPVVSMANRDAFRAPVIEMIDASAYGGEPGDVIAVDASDDTGVVRVDVALADAEGEVFETGAAEIDADGWWLYTARTAVPEGTYVRVVARANDRPNGAGLGWVDLTVDRSASRGARPARRRDPVGGDHPALKVDGCGGAPPRSPSPAGARAFSLSSTESVTANSLSDEEELADSLSRGAAALLDPAGLLREARVHAGLTQRQLARQAGTAQSVVLRIERGKASPTVDTLLRLLNAAGFELAGRLVARTTT